MSHAQPEGFFAAPHTRLGKGVLVLRQAGRPVAFHCYNGTGHWFFEPDRAQVFNPAAASLAWDRMLAFLKRSSTS